MWRMDARNPGGNGCSSADLDPVRPSVLRLCSSRHISDSWRNCCNCCHVPLSCQLHHCCDRDRAQIPRYLLEDAGKPIFREVNLFFAFGGEYQRFETGGSHKLAWSTVKTRLSQYEFELAKRPNDAYGRQHVNNAKNDTQPGSSTSISQSSPGADIDTAWPQEPVPSLWPVQSASAAQRDTTHAYYIKLEGRTRQGLATKHASSVKSLISSLFSLSLSSADSNARTDTTH